MSKRREILRILGAALVGQPLGAMAQLRENAVARLVVGFPAGATGDRIARAVAPVLAAHLKTSVIVENRPGAGGQLGIEYVKGAPADGALLLQTIGSSMVIYPHTYRSLRYDPFTDFIPVGTAATAPVAFVAAANVPAANLREALALVRKDKKYGFYGSPAAGSVFHFSGVMLERAMSAARPPEGAQPPPLADGGGGYAKRASLGEASSVRAEFTHVAFKGSAPLLTDVLSGQVPFAFMAPSDILEHHRAGKLKILAVTGSSRTAQLPEVPAFPEAGFKDLVNREWFSYFLPRGTLPETVAQYRAALRKAVASDEVRGKLQAAGLEIGDGDAATLAATMQREHAQWKQVVKDSGFTAD